jgi:hypothetical protein
VTGREQSKKVEGVEEISTGTVNAALGIMYTAILERNSAFYTKVGI